MTDYYAITDATWPAARYLSVGNVIVREGKGGGQRVSSATVQGDWCSGDIARAEAAQAALGQRSLFMIRAGEDALDAELAARGYSIVDPVAIYVSDVAALAVKPPPLTAFSIWPPLEIMRDIWAEGNVGPDRIAVMERANCPKTAILGRSNDRAAGAAYVAIHDETAMMHALHVVPDQRRQGTAVNIMRCAAVWAQDQAAKRFSVIVTRANTAANTLYASLGMQIVGHYHYRSK
ncbi:MAG: GNAT family N-acetyltransferase [Albidovulum sp.]